MEEQKHTIALTDLDKVELYKLSSTMYNCDVISTLKKFNTWNSYTKQYLLCILRAKSLNELTLKHYYVNTNMRVQYCDIRDKSSRLFIESLYSYNSASITLHSSIEIFHITVGEEKFVNTNQDLHIMQFNYQDLEYDDRRIYIYFTQNTSAKRARIITKINTFSIFNYEVTRLYYCKRRAFSHMIDDKTNTINGPTYKEKIHNASRIYDRALLLYPYNAKGLSMEWRSMNTEKQPISNFAEYSSTNLITLLSIIPDIYYEIPSLNQDMVSSELQKQIQCIWKEPIKNLHNSNSYARLYRLICDCHDVIHDYESKQLDIFIKQHLSDQVARDECTKWLHSQRNKIITPLIRWLSTNII